MKTMPLDFEFRDKDYPAMHVLEVDLPFPLVLELRQWTKENNETESSFCRRVIEAHANDTWPQKVKSSLSLYPESEELVLHIGIKEIEYLNSIAADDGEPTFIMSTLVARWFGYNLQLEQGPSVEEPFLIVKLPARLLKLIEAFCGAKKISASTLSHRVIEAHAAGERTMLGNYETALGHTETSSTVDTRRQELTPVRLFLEKKDLEYLDTIGAVPDFERDTVMTLLFLYWFNYPFLSHIPVTIPDAYRNTMKKKRLRIRLAPHIVSWVEEDCAALGVGHYSLLRAAIEAVFEVDRIMRGKWAPRPSIPKSLPPRRQRSAIRKKAHVILDEVGIARIDAIAAVSGLERTSIVVILFFDWFKIPLLAPAPARIQLSKEFN